jgi:hypothetical protein
VDAGAVDRGAGQLWKRSFGVGAIELGLVLPVRLVFGNEAVEVPFLVGHFMLRQLLLTD